MKHLIHDCKLKYLFSFLALIMCYSANTYADEECNCGINMMCTKCENNVCQSCQPIPE